MRTLFWIAVISGMAVWIVSLQRRLEAARMRGDMYRDISARLDRKVVELSGREPWRDEPLGFFTTGLRVPEQEEREGLDIGSHGERAYS